MPRIAMQVALGLGTAGALVDVTSYVSNTIGITHRYGREDEFRDAAPGTIGFTLFNTDGRFTPGNSSQPYATAITEGTAVAWLVGGRIRSGQVQAFVFPQDEASWSEMTIICDDMLGNAARTSLTGATVADALVANNNPLMYWPLTDAAGTRLAAELSGTSQPPIRVGLGTFGSTSATFGTAAISGVGRTQLQVSTAANSAIDLQVAGDVGNTIAPAGSGATNSTITYPATSAGAWGFWLTPLSNPCDIDFTISVFLVAPLFHLTLSSLASGISLTLFGGTAATSTALTLGVPYYISITTKWNNGVSLVATLLVNGVAQGTSTFTTAATGSPTVLFAPLSISAHIGSNTNPMLANISGIAHTAAGINETLVTNVATEAGWLAALGGMSTGVSIGTIPTDLSTVPIGPVTLSQSNQLSLLNDVIRTEQGHIYSVTTGTLLAPVQTLVVRARQRPVSPTATFDAQAEISGMVPFIRDITNLVSSVTATGIGASARAVDLDVVSRAASSSVSETVLNSQTVDLLAWGQDRINRGKNATLRTVSVTIDALTTPTDRSSALLALVPGDRIRISNIPPTMLGITQWDGWLLGAIETHSLMRHEFVLYLSPVLPDVAIYDTNLWSGGDNFSLGFVASTDTTMRIFSRDNLTTFETAVFPYNLQLENEIVTVTACTALATGFQTATITRGVLGTTAVTHDGTVNRIVVDVAPSSLYAF